MKPVLRRTSNGSVNPYDRFTEEDLILRDHLAFDRTVLANERTFLAYVRTALALLVVGGSFVKFLDSFATHAIGCVFIALGVGVFVLGMWRFRVVQRRLSAARKASERRDS